MDLIQIEFEEDLERVDRLVSLLEHIKKFAGVDSSKVSTSGNGFLEAAQVIHEQSRLAHTDSYILSGTLILYLGGRFEYYIRTLFEDLCIRLANKARSYNELPKTMQDNLIRFTAEVMLNPRKYGHGDKGVKSFVSLLASHFDETVTFKQINASCLSITHENMRATTLSELFERIGGKDLWQKIGQQAKIQAFFETGDPDLAKKKAMTQLNNFVDLRNQIAHPSANISWPDLSHVTGYITFLKVLGSAIADLISVYEINLSNRQSNNST